MKFGTMSPGRYTGADRYTGVAVGRRSTVHLETAASISLFVVQYFRWDGRKARLQ